MHKFAILAATTALALTALAAPVLAQSNENYRKPPRGGSDSSYDCGSQASFDRCRIPRFIANSHSWYL